MGYDFVIREVLATMTDFFISYTSVDRAWAEWIAWELEAVGFKVVIQAWDFQPGDSFIAKMHRATQECKRTLIVLSGAYQRSHFGEMEWTTALAQKKRLSPVRIEEVEPEGLLKGIVYIDLVGLTETAARNELLAGVKQGRAKPRKKPSYPGKSRPTFPGPGKDDLTALPLKDVPEPGPLPEGSRMPLSVNPLFVGRGEDLRALARQLSVEKTSVISQVEIAGVSGLGGIGKTQLASEFVHRYGRHFEGGVFWMSFAEPASVPAEVAACGQGLDLHPSFGALPLDEQVRLVEEDWKRPVPRLLVFDNCEEEQLLNRWRPKTGGARVLVTSRRSQWDPTLDVRPVPLTTLPRSASLELLRHFRPDLPAQEPALNEIAADLGDLPLALHLAGSFLKQYVHSPIGKPAAYLAALRRKGLLDHPSLQRKDVTISPTGHTAHVARTFALSFERLSPEDEIDALARSLLGRAAYFAWGEPIPRDLLLKTMGSIAEDPDDTRTEDALARLTDLGLVESNEEGALVVHRLVASFARNAGNGEEDRITVEETLLEEANRLNNAGVPRPLLVWQAHLRSVTEGAWHREDTTAAGLANALGFHLWMIGDYSGARQYFERALAIREKVLGAEHPDTAPSLNNLGALLDSQGDLVGARPYFERALAINEEVLGEEHSHTAKSLNNLGGLLASQGDQAGAWESHERALAIREKFLGPAHPDTARSLYWRGFLLKRQGDLAGARLHYERALAIWEKALGPEHPDTKSLRSALEPLPKAP